MLKKVVIFTSFYYQIMKSVIHIKSQIYGAYTHYLLYYCIKLCLLKFITYFNCHLLHQRQKILDELIFGRKEHQKHKNCSMNSKNQIDYMNKKSDIERIKSILIY